MAARMSQDLALPLGNPGAAFAPFNGAGPFTLQGDVDLARFLERPIISSDVLGTVSAFRVARQNVIQSDLVFPTSMLFGDQFDDQSASLGMPLGGALSVEITCALDAAGDLSGYVATTPWEGETADPEVVFGPSAYNYIYGFGTAAPGAAPFTLTARANRRVKLGRMCWEAIGAAMDISSIQVAVGAPQRARFYSDRPRRYFEPLAPQQFRRGRILPRQVDRRRRSRGHYRNWRSGWNHSRRLLPGCLGTDDARIPGRYREAFQAPHGGRWVQLRAPVRPTRDR
jgi:hypothetical protein